MSIDREAESSTSFDSTTFYTHETELSSRNKVILRITSIRFPELQLRLPTADDAAALLDLFSDERNIRYDRSCSGLNTQSAIDDLIRQWRDVGHPLERLNIIVTVQGKTIGTGGLGWIGRRKSDGKLIGDAGVLLDSDFRGRGYAYEALSMIIDHGFYVLRLDEVHLACVDANVAFKGLINVKFGFQSSPIQDKLFGNEWIWRIRREMWSTSVHSADGGIEKRSKMSIQDNKTPNLVADESR